MTTQRRPDGREESERRPTRLLARILRAVVVQVKIAPTLSVTLAVTFSLTMYSFTTIVSADDTGWAVSGTRTTTALAVTIERALEVKNDVRITGSVLEMAGPVCDEESPAGTGRICFDGDDFRLSQDGGSYLTMDGLDCWDANGNGRRDVAEDRTGDGLLDALDRQGVPGLRGPGGDAGLRGPKGDTGDTGPLGPKGDAGEPGLAVGVRADQTQEACVIQLPEDVVMAGGTATLVEGACRIVLSDLAIAAANAGRLNVQVTAWGDPCKLSPI